MTMPPLPPPPSPYPIHPPPPHLHPLLNHHHLFFSFFAALPYSSPPMLPSTVWDFPISLSPSSIFAFPTPPLQGSNHVLPKLPNLAPTPSAIPDIPTIETSQNIPSIPQSSDHGGSKRSFRINAKLFSFSFDGGWFDLYAMHETRWNVKSSI